MPKIVGIDLGTTNSVVAVMEGNEPTVISLADGGRLCPSVVGFSRTGERLVGSLAKRQALAAPERSISSIKRHMGSDHTVTIDNRNYTPQEISAMILQKLKADAESYLGEKVAQAVITVPAYYSDAQRQATKDAGTLAGLEVIRIINEPTAAALAYGANRPDVQNVLVWDLGGGTFDVSLLEMGDGFFEVRATSGDTNLGGDDWDARLMDWLAEQYQKQNGSPLRLDRATQQRLKEAAEKAKIELSHLPQTNINLPFLSVTPSGPAHLDVDLNRLQMERLCNDLLQRLVPPTRQALADARMQTSDLDLILLVGGSTRMPAVQELARQMFGKEPYRGMNPDEAIALGAAIQAGVLNEEVTGILLLDVTPLSLGIETIGGEMSVIIPRNTTIPTQGKQVFSTARDAQTSVDIRVYQGEQHLAQNNRFLADFSLRNIPPMLRHQAKIEVTFDIDVNGIVHVTAMEMNTGQRQQVQINNATGLSAEEIARLAKIMNSN